MASVYLSASTVHDNSLPRFFGKRYDFLNGRFEVGVQNANLGVPNGSFSAMVRFSDFTAIWISGKTLSTPERWAHVVFVKSTNYIELFINGVSEAKASIPEKAMLQTTGPLAIGSNGWVGPEQSWTGRMQNARYYNRALSPDEAQLLFQHDTGRPLQVPRRATGIAQVVNGFVVGIMVTDGGSGYTNAPVVYITGLGSGAQGIATITNGVVTGITITQTGSGYTSVPDVRIASPPFYPTLSIATSKVKVTQNVVLGRKYLLQASIDLSTWSNVGNPFIATDESITVELDVEVVGKYFRIQQVP